MCGKYIFLSALFFVSSWSVASEKNSNLPEHIYLTSPSLSLTGWKPWDYSNYRCVSFAQEQAVQDVQITKATCSNIEHQAQHKALQVLVLSDIVKHKTKKDKKKQSSISGDVCAADDSCDSVQRNQQVQDIVVPSKKIFIPKVSKLEKQREQQEREKKLKEEIKARKDHQRKLSYEFREKVKLEEAAKKNALEQYDDSFDQVLNQSCQQIQRDTFSQREELVTKKQQLLFQRFNNKKTMFPWESVKIVQDLKNYGAIDPKDEEKIVLGCMRTDNFICDIESRTGVSSKSFAVTDDFWGRTLEDLHAMVDASYVEITHGVQHSVFQSKMQDLLQLQYLKKSDNLLSFIQNHPDKKNNIASMLRAIRGMQQDCQDVLWSKSIVLDIVEQNFDQINKLFNAIELNTAKK